MRFKPAGISVLLKRKTYTQSLTELLHGKTTSFKGQNPESAAAKKNSNTQCHISDEITRLVHSKLIKLLRFVLTEGNANG